MKLKAFTHQIVHHEAILKKYEPISNVVGYLKLLLVALLGILVYFAVINGFGTAPKAPPFAMGLVVLVALVALWIYHHQIREKVRYSTAMIAINQRHLDRISGEWVNFSDIGVTFINHEHPYGSDLDIVGEKSLFQFLNTTHTWHGRKAFVDSLLSPKFSEDEIIKRQASIAELGTDIAFSNHMEHIFSKIGIDARPLQLINGLKDRQLFLKSKWIKCLLLYLPFVMLVVGAMMVLLRPDELYTIIAFVALLQLMVWGIGMKKAKRYLRSVSYLTYQLDAYSEVVETFKNREFQSEQLKQIQQSLGGSELSAAGAIKALGKIANRMSVQNNGLIWLILNVALLWDYDCAIRLEDWKLKYAHLAEGWFLALGEFESLLCFANLPHVCDHTCLPSMTDEKAIEAKELGHPLISNEKRVNNDVACEDNIFIISGSNMSGKTTFMRTVGINLVLARAGSFVCASQMRFSPLEIMTSMRIADNLSEGISTFYAELKRIKGIISLAEKESRMIFLIDEIFRGTNSVDRLSGAKAVLSKLDEMGAIGLITTHDLELCDIASEYPRIKNYSFSEDYYDNQIHFDYKLKSGKSTTTNAKYLMEMMGIGHATL